MSENFQTFLKFSKFFISFSKNTVTHSYHCIEGFINDFSSCSAYYSCVNFLAFMMECPVGFHYLQTGAGQGICHYPDIANCQRCPPQGVKLVSEFSINLIIFIIFLLAVSKTKFVH